MSPDNKAFMRGWNYGYIRLVQQLSGYSWDVKAGRKTVSVWVRERISAIRRLDDVSDPFNAGVLAAFGAAVGE